MTLSARPLRLHAHEGAVFAAGALASEEAGFVAGWYPPQSLMVVRIVSGRVLRYGWSTSRGKVNPNHRRKPLTLPTALKPGGRWSWTSARPAGAAEGYAQPVGIACIRPPARETTSSTHSSTRSSWSRAVGSLARRHQGDPHACQAPNANAYAERCVRTLYRLATTPSDLLAAQVGAGRRLEAEIAEWANLLVEGFQALSVDERNAIADEYTMWNLRNIPASTEDE